MPAVSINRKVEAPQAITGQTVGTTLKDDSSGCKHFHDLANHRAKDTLVGLVVHAIIQGKVDGIVLSNGFGALLKHPFSKYFDGSFIEYGISQRKKTGIEE